MNLLQSTVFYIVMLLICMFFSNLADRKNNKKLLLIPILILTLVGGLRSWYTGVDTYGNYLGAEYYYNGGSIFNKLGYAPGYGLFVSIIYKIWHNYNFLLSIETCLTISLIFLRFWDFRDKASYKYMIFDFLMVWFIDMFTLKVQYIALAISFFGTRYLFSNDKKSILKYILLTFLAISFHVSAFVNFLILFIYRFDAKKLTKKKILELFLILIFLIIVTVIAKDVFSARYLKYYLNRESHFGYMNFVRIFMLITTLFFAKNVFKDHTNKKIFKITFVGFLINFIGYYIGNAGRAIMYLTIYNCVIFGMVLKDKRTDLLYRILLIVYVILYTVYVISHSNITDGYLYNFFFNH